MYAYLNWKKRYKTNFGSRSLRSKQETQRHAIPTPFFCYNQSQMIYNVWSPVYALLQSILKKKRQEDERAQWITRQERLCQRFTHSIVIKMTTRRMQKNRLRYSIEPFEVQSNGSAIGQQEARGRNAPAHRSYQPRIQRPPYTIQHPLPIFSNSPVIYPHTLHKITKSLCIAESGDGKKRKLSREIITNG